MDDTMIAHPDPGDGRSKEEDDKVENNKKH